MKHTKIEAKANTQNPMQDTVDEDSSSESGNLANLFLQDLSETSQVEVNGGQQRANDNFSKTDNEDKEGGCKGGDCGDFDIIVWDVVG